ncbi:type II CAAX endopeptidase family protein [Candidatus Villigracilis proximus]|uniref:CPBP family intramembrane glutamic endopeptidase n=1 Tax=Candidatus Villigracilis proximus TaxID=3140683 RepID=UPI0031F197BB
MEWFTKSRLFDLARQGQRLTSHRGGHSALIFICAFRSTRSHSSGNYHGINLWVYRNRHFHERRPPLEAGFWMSLQLILSFVLVYAILWAWLKFFEKRPFWTLGYEAKNALMQYGRGFLAGALMFGGAVAILAVTGGVVFEQGDPTQQGFAALGGVIIVLLGWIVQGGAEEVLIRGWVLPVIGARYKPWIGLLVSSLIFALLHGLNPGLSVIALINLALFGVFAGLYAMREGSMWGISALHSVWNWVQGNFFGFEVSGTNAGGGTLLNLKETGADWLTGGAFGPEGGLAVTIVLVIAIAVTLFWKSKAIIQEVIVE